MAKVYLKDYKVSAYEIPETYLDFNIVTKQKVEVHARLFCKRRVARIEQGAGENWASAKTAHHSQRVPLVLHGVGLNLLALTLNEKPLARAAYSVTTTALIIHAPPAVFTLETTVSINPAENTYLEGLYLSGETLCTQNEAHGFRRITYYLDRPDILSVFTIWLRSAKVAYPTLLAGGNKISAHHYGEELAAQQVDFAPQQVVNASDWLAYWKKRVVLVEKGQHSVLYHDPIAKPCYLVAIVAGALERLQEDYFTKSGRNISLELYTPPGNKQYGTFALQVLARALRWDEETFDLEYDLDAYKIAAVSDFNFGAMENKGLNIFNDALILTAPQTTTDEEYKRIETIIAHEYFHNWSGNRVTLRDWFQLTLKEGLTVYRDQQFTAALYSRVVKRIEDVMMLRSRQFREAASPLAHALQPVVYEKVDNFYTATIYEKGAEVIRMLATWLGEEVFYAILKAYFRHFDGKAITVEDFLTFIETRYAAQCKQRSGLAVISAELWQQFRRWYKVKTTPIVRVREEVCPKRNVLMVTCEQQFKQIYSAKTPNATAPTRVKDFPLVIPIKWALSLKKGVYILTKAKEKWEIPLAGAHSEQRPYLSLGQDFSAPVLWERGWDLSAWVQAFECEQDPFNSWDALQQLFLTTFRLYQERYNHLRVSVAASQVHQGQQQAIMAAENPEFAQIAVTDFFTAALAEKFFTQLHTRLVEEEDLLYVAQCLTFPKQTALYEHMEQLDIRCLGAFEGAWLDFLYKGLGEALLKRYQTLSKNDSPAARILAGVLLRLLVKGNRAHLQLAHAAYAKGERLRDILPSFNLIMYHDSKARERVAQDFYAKWKDNSRVINKWLTAWSMVPTESIFKHLPQLEQDRCYSSKEPNKVYALWGAFAQYNVEMFNHSSGRGYRCVAEAIISLDASNPHVSTHLITQFQHCYKLITPYRKQATTALRHIENHVHSPNALEIVRTLTASLGE